MKPRSIAVAAAALLALVYGTHLLVQPSADEEREARIRALQAQQNSLAADMLESWAQCVALEQVSQQAGQACYERATRRAEHAGDMLQRLQRRIDAEGGAGDHDDPPSAAAGTPGSAERSR